MCKLLELDKNTWNHRITCSYNCLQISRIIKIINYGDSDYYARSIFYWSHFHFKIIKQKGSQKKKEKIKNKTKQKKHLTIKTKQSKAKQK